MPISVHYHGLFVDKDAKLFDAAFFIIREQMLAFEQSGLLEAASEFVVGLNGHPEATMDYARLAIPPKAKIILHGKDSFAENPTLLHMAEFAQNHPDWIMAYAHSKSATHDPQSDYGKFATKWRRCMEETVIWNWRECVKELESGRYDACGNHWLTGQGWDHSQHYFAGNHYWITAKFLNTIPSMLTRERIRTSGLSSLESRYEAEVIIGNGPRLPRVRDFANHALMQCP